MRTFFMLFRMWVTRCNPSINFLTYQPDYRPYRALSVDKRIFDPQKALDPYDKNFNWKALEESPEMDNVDDMIRQSKENDSLRQESRE